MYYKLFVYPKRSMVNEQDMGLALIGMASGDLGIVDTCCIVGNHFGWAGQRRL